jgi:hypothetical protein
MRSVCTDKRRRFMTILGNVLNVGESAEGEERVDRPHPHPGGLLEGARRGGMRKIARQRTSPRRSGGDMSAARSA